MWNSWVRVSDALILILFPRCLSGKDSTCQCKRRRRHRFDPWIGKIPWRGKWQPIPVFLLGKFHGQRGLAVPVCGVTKSQTQLSNWSHMQCWYYALQWNCSDPHPDQQVHTRPSHFVLNASKPLHSEVVKPHGRSILAPESPGRTAALENHPDLHWRLHQWAAKFWFKTLRVGGSFVTAAWSSPSWLI